METRDTGINGGRLIVGLAILTIGVLTLAGNLIDIRIGAWHQLWPLILIGVGIYRFSEAEEPRRRQGGLVLAAVGTWLLINTLGLMGLHFDDSWPLLLVLIGLAKLIYPVVGRGRASGLFLIALGALFQVIVLGLWGLNWDNAWPLILILAGILVITKALTDSRHRSIPTKGEES